jgi:hypothetical protein
MTDAPLALTLKDAAERYGFTVATLRAEHQRGRLALYRIGKRLYTTPAAIREMLSQCLVEVSVPAFIATRRAVSMPSAMEAASLDSAQAVLRNLRGSSRNTSRPSIAQRQMKGR